MKRSEDHEFPVPSAVARVLDALSESARPHIAGGAVRDWILGNPSKDLDVEVFGLSWDQLTTVLREFGRVDEVGKSFGVAKVRLGGREVDFALPRTEIKTSSGHRGFDVSHNPDLDPARAALRRDFTVNSISYDWKIKKVIDPLNGQRDLEQKILRHSSPAFVEDPLRVLRGFQFCARFELSPADETVELCRQIHASFSQMVRERVWMEWEKWATQSVRPSLGLKFLKSTGWLKHFAEIAALVDCPQDPEWHPEGDVFVHTCHCLDALVETDHFRSADRFDRLTLMFAVLAHDFGKPLTTCQKIKDGKERWVSPVHDRAGLPLAESFLRTIGAPLLLIPKVQALVANHMIAIQINKRPSFPQVRRLARRVSPSSLEQLFTVIRADQSGRPPLSAEPSQGLLWLEEVAYEDSLLAESPKPLVLGRHLIAQGLQPGPHFKDILDELFELQLDGEFTSVGEAQPLIEKLCKSHGDQA